uniref:Peroxisomal membrane protein PEX14 n=1 Tax=Parastrongyloides trichosuri TaxID=131310 RepID=A0A0N4Z6M1_PARTI
MSTIEIRNEMVEAAIKFMSNPKVRSTSIDEQKKFLQEKGLTDEEIKKAIEEVGYIPVNHKETFEEKQVHKGDSIFSKIQNILVWSGALYGSYTLIKNYIMPDEKIKVMETQISELQNSLKFLIDSTSQILLVSQEQEKSLNQLMQILSHNVEKDSKTGEMYNDISTIKKLLLGKDQFPSIREPKLTDNNSFHAILSNGDKECGVPSWQMPNSKESIEYEEVQSDNDI